MLPAVDKDDDGDDNGAVTIEMVQIGGDENNNDDKNGKNDDKNGKNDDKNDGKNDDNVDKDNKDNDDNEDPGSDFRASIFARKEEFAWWFPKNTEDEKPGRRMWKSKRSLALLLQIGLILAILLANLGLTIYAVTQYDSQNGVGVIYQGDCGTVASLDQWLHLAINLLGTGMLSASNYCMQLQAAPTRADVDRAHERGRWLDIGVSSVRNIRYIGNGRRLAWLLLAVSSVPIHLMYVGCFSLLDPLPVLGRDDIILFVPSLP